MKATTVFFCLILLLFACTHHQPTNTTPPIKKAFCDMEKTLAGSFIHNFDTFSKGKTQSDSMAFEGAFSALVNAESPYTSDYTLKNIKRGNYLKVSVWRYSNCNSGAIAISGDGIYMQSGEPVLKKNGWEKIELSCTFDKDYDKVTVYAFNLDNCNTYFDNLEVNLYERRMSPLIDENALRINIEPTDYEKLKAYRDSAMKQGIIGSDQKEYINASIRYKNETYPVELRLKGDWIDHLSSDKWSFRIKVKGEKTIRGLASFSIQNPNTRGFLREWEIHKIFEKEDILTTRYDFIAVEINDINLGYYAIEEHFEKQLIESRRRREGPILKFNEEGFWEYNMLNNQSFDKALPFFSAAEVEPFKPNKTMKSETLKQNFTIANELMLRYKNFDLKLDEIFDIQQLAKYYALCDLGNVMHGMRWHNMRMYYNPVTSRLEHIAFDCYPGDVSAPSRRPILGYGDDDNEFCYDDFLTFYVFNNNEFRKYYTQYLEKYSNKKFVDHLLKSFDKQLDSLEMRLQEEFPYYKEDRDAFRNNANLIRADLSGYKKANIKFVLQKKENIDLSKQETYLPGVGLKAYEYPIDSTKTANVSLYNFHQQPLEIVGYSLKSDPGSVIYIHPSIAMKGYESSPDKKQTTLPTATKWIYFKATNLGDSLLRTKYSKWDFSVYELRKTKSLTQTSILQESRFRVDKQHKNITIPTGSYTFSKNLYVPQGWLFIIEPGVKIDLTQGAAIITYSPVMARGKKENPIEIYSSDQKGQGFILLGNYERSELHYVTFSHLTSLNQKGWTLTGDVTFYQSDLCLKNCTFTNNHSEDCVNVIRSKIDIDQMTVSNTFSDGFDADFCSGTITNSTFYNTGNDCFDVSGSQIKLKNCEIEKSGDKGVSAGEESNVTVYSCNIKDSHIGIASKDKSYVNADKISITDCHCAYAVYQKKSEYGFSQIDIDESKENNITEMYLIDKGCVINHRNKELTSEKRVNVDSIYAPFAKKN